MFRREKDNLSASLVKEEKEKLKQMGAREYGIGLRLNKAIYGEIPEEQIQEAMVVYKATRSNEQTEGIKQAIASGVKEAVGENVLYTLGSSNRLIIERYKTLRQ